MSDVYFTYRDNLFNRYVGERVRVTIRNRRKREKVFIGTFMAYDYHVNVVLADVYRVILHHTQEQKQDVRGLLLIRGVNIRSIRELEEEPRLPPWPSNPKSRKQRGKSDKSPVRSQKAFSAPSTPTTPSKAVKLKRSWLTASSPGGSLQPATPQTEEPEKETEGGRGKDDVVESSESQIEEGRVHEKQEVVVKREADEEVEGIEVKKEEMDSPSSNKS